MLADAMLVATVAVTDLDRARRFFHEQLGLPLVEETPLGSALLERVNEEAHRLGLDYLLVHPSARSVPFYRRGGFNESDEFLVLRLSPR